MLVSFDVGRFVSPFLGVRAPIPGEKFQAMACGDGPLGKRAPQGRTPDDAKGCMHSALGSDRLLVAVNDA